jgi:RNA polymerase sigma-70 factor (ECF subfamily)
MLAEARTVAEPVDSIAVLIAEGDFRKAVSLCARSYGPALGRMCMALLGSQADAEEVVQETLIAAHRGMGAYRGEGNVRAWLFGIARRQCARHLERKRAQRRHLELVPNAPDEDGGPERAVATRRRARAVREALRRLKPSERETLVLRYQAELSFREIGAICGVEEAAARKRASRGLQHLRTLLPAEVLE